MAFYPFLHPLGFSGGSEGTNHSKPPHKDAQAALLGLRAALSFAQGNTKISPVLGWQEPSQCWALPRGAEQHPQSLALPQARLKAALHCQPWAKQLWSQTTDEILIPNYRGNPDSSADPRWSDIASNAAESSSPGGPALPPPAQKRGQRNQSSTITIAQK